MFAAGLLLGFGLFAEDGESTDTEEAFSSARAVLEYMSGQSPQAKHYHDILTSLDDAIRAHRQKLAQDKRKTSSVLLDQIFTIDFDGGTERSYLSPSSGGNGPSEVASGDVDLDNLLPDHDFNVDVSATLPMMWDDFGEDWQALALDMDGSWA